MISSATRTFILCWALLCAGASFGNVLTGVVTHVSDGDTLWVRLAEGGEPVKVRFQGMDAPEGCQDWGPQASQALKARALHQNVQITTRARDDYGRLLARVSMGEEDVGAWMVAQGHAWSYHYRGRDGPYASEELSARSARRGLWAAATPMEPRAFRKQHGACTYPDTKNRLKPIKTECKQLLNK
jgi:micrococcal nuclease